MNLRKLILGLAAIACAADLSANNIQVTNATLTGNTGTSVKVQFDLSWENSWRGGGVSNWDAAWVFVKYKLPNGLWQHVRLSNSGHTVPATAQLDPGLLTPGTPHDPMTNPVLGVFIYRSAAGNGTFSLNGIQLDWSLTNQGINFNDITEVRVFAIEMVYVPQGPFAAGSGSLFNGEFIVTTINSAIANSSPSGSGVLGGQAGGYPTAQTAPNSNWPNGYKGFYCMKYEISEQGYADLLNSLTYSQQVTRTGSSPASAVGTMALAGAIKIQIPGIDSSAPAVYACDRDGDGQFEEINDGKDGACGYLNWGDLTAYLDWSGLRPMTELEYEKSCRGGIPPVPNEFPWGTTTITNDHYTYTQIGTPQESIATDYSTIEGNAFYTGTSAYIAWASLRVGIFAGHPLNSGRISSGATYYGIMEMAGNLWERTISIGNASGRAFTGTHGNGVLLPDGHADPLTWPAPLTAVGSGVRGGSRSTVVSELRVSDRSYTSDAVSQRDYEFGGRGVRTAP